MDLAALAAAPLSYSFVGATREPGAAVPAGFRSLERAAALGHGDAAWQAVRVGVLGWGVQRGAGLRVRTAGDPSRIREGDVAIVTVPPWPAGLPVRVVYAIDEPDRAGFGYGTLPGHAECGEEAWIAERHGDEVRLVIRAISRPAGVYRLAAPVLRLVQERVTERYLRALGPVAARDGRE